MTVMMIVIVEVVGEVMVIIDIVDNQYTARQFCDTETKYFQNEFLRLLKTRYDKNQKGGPCFIKTVQNNDF